MLPTTCRAPPFPWPRPRPLAAGRARGGYGLGRARGVKRRAAAAARGVVVRCGLLPVDPWAPTMDSQSVASQLFAVSLFPYLGFLYFMTRSKTAPGLTLFGFYFLLAFVGATTKVHYGTSLSNVDWLHGSAESLLTLTNLFIVLGLRGALRKLDTKESGSEDSQDIKEKAQLKSHPPSSAVIAAAMDDGGGHRRRRTTQDKHRSLLLDKVRSSHEEALERLRPAAVAADLDAGLCFGLLDPVSNAIVNAVLTAAPKNRKMRRARRRTRRRRRSRRRRSLDGSVAFLTSFFPYLPEWEAVYYLLLADADVLVAARLVVQARGLRRFGFTSDTTAAAVRLALRCAALAVKHPHPDRLVHVWLSLSRRLDEAVSALANRDVRGLVALRCGRGIAARHYWHAMPLQMALLHAIQGFYLRALSRLPSGERRSRYHRSLVKAGHCYGPMDPVSNIILNVVWYDAAHPPVEELELAMIPPKSMSSIATRSFLGLVSFLCTRYPNLELHDAIRCLLDADADLNAAAREAERRQRRPSCTIQEA
uniref:PIR2-like helical domain-containing protein n=1 Tax=Oryza glumipatula TaxID=40148 RepID=A0A0E0A323_9ORYZ